MAALLRGAVLLGGLVLMGYGLYGMLGDPFITDPVSVLVWGAWALVLHDGWWVPLLCLAGRYAVRGPVLRGWLIVAAAVTAVGLPAVLRTGDDNGNPSVLPLPYLRNLLLVLAATAGLALLLALARRWRGMGGGAGPHLREVAGGISARARRWARWAGGRARPQGRSSGRPGHGRRGSHG
ncbi:hypothetical protein [Kitasatospora kifunensis]|uniref:Uncharacterized protein n=1 Tax=Kitasatospora kifunensis TaxID=58351 RepID=A0A7W7VYA5_KITKI|nr:hypothetical protein [Kitasatospora kifunensis]MBB4927492.1 hypothetical protein [Kitasatospora kifunensis]